MSGVVVDLEQLAELIERMARFQHELIRLGDHVEARAQRLHESWIGRAAVEYAQAQARWAAGAAEVHDALVTLRAVAVTAHANFAAATLANRRMWAQ